MSYRQNIERLGLKTVPAEVGSQNIDSKCLICKILGRKKLRERPIGDCRYVVKERAEQKGHVMCSASS